MTIWELLEKAPKTAFWVEALEKEGTSLPEAECYFSRLGRDWHALEEEGRHTTAFSRSTCHIYLLIPGVPLSHLSLLSSWPVAATSGVPCHSKLLRPQLILAELQDFCCHENIRAPQEGRGAGR